MRLETFLTCVFSSVMKGEQQTLATFEGNHRPIYKQSLGSVTKTWKDLARHRGHPECHMVPFVTELIFKRGDRAEEVGPRTTLAETVSCVRPCLGFSPTRTSQHTAGWVLPESRGRAGAECEFPGR